MIASLAGYEEYGSRIEEMASGNYTDEALSFGPMMLSYILIPLFNICFGPELKRRFADKIPYFNLWYFFSFFWACGYFLVCNVSHVFIRPLEYFSLFEMLIASLLLFHLFHPVGISMKKSLPIALLFVCVIWANTCWNITKAEAHRGNESVIYKTFFTESDEVRKAEQSPF